MLACGTQGGQAALLSWGERSSATSAFICESSGFPEKEHANTMSTNPSLRCKIITDFAELEALAGDWGRLWNSAPRRDVFNAFAWARAWWRSCGSRLSLYTPVAYRGDRVVGILPLVIDGCTLRFLGFGHSDYNDMLCDAEDATDVLEAALRALFQRPTAWDSCVLENVPESAWLVACLDKLSGWLRARLHLSFCNHCPRVALETAGAEPLKSILKKKSLLRHEKALSRLGDVRFRHMESRDEIRSHLPAFFRQHIARRALAGDKSLFCAEEACCFYRALVDELDPQRELRFSVLELDERPIAYHFGFEVHGTFFWYKPTFDADLCGYSPGEVLLKKLFEHAGQKRLQVFDFTVGDEAFKNRFANQVHRNYRLRLFPSAPLAIAGKLLLETKERLAKYPQVRYAAAALRALWHRAPRPGVEGPRKHAPMGLQ
jgi:CelD/BcsL family acetyltransferase involved in cellulose biosynthesis